ncbi:MAG: type-2 restriction-modification system deoxyribonuclease BsuRB [Armatimonadaceae bacterium]
MPLSSPAQIIMFGSPGTGKSYQIKTKFLPQLEIDPSSGNYNPTVFHPEYTYGDFMGKLLPRSIEGKVTYNYEAGHFLRALARAYRNLLQAESQPNVALVIDEINRGNSASIFGTVFQLLDRGVDGWSNYEVSISDMEFDTLLDEIGVEIKYSVDTGKVYEFNGKQYSTKTVENILKPLNLNRNQIKLPPNFSLIATMNTSDNSIYYMDTAFKRRRDWQFVDNDSELSRAEGIAFASRREWEKFVKKLNFFIRRNHRYIRRVEDKQVGHWFLTGEEISKTQVQNKVMFYLWDSVFSTNRQPLIELLKIESDSLVTFGDFTKRVDGFIEQVLSIED